MTAVAHSPAETAPGLMRWHALGWIGLVTVYVLVFSMTGYSALLSVVHAIANVLPAALLGLVCHLIIRRQIMKRPVAVQLGLHIGLAVAFVALWYVALVPILAVPNWILGHGFHPELLTGPALPWQLYQGLMIYAVVAAAAYALEPAKRATATAAPQPLTRYLMRSGDDIRPVDVEAIITVQGADDYSEVTTPAGRHLARMTLGAFERDLDPQRFIRIHRSWIINFDRLERAEPAGGGRLLAHMQDGQVVPTSRAGARALRDRLV